MKKFPFIIGVIDRYCKLVVLLLPCDCNKVNDLKRKQTKNKQTKTKQKQKQKTGLNYLIRCSKNVASKSNF